MATINSLHQDFISFIKTFDAHVLEDQQMYRTTQGIQTILSERTDTIKNIQEHVKNVDARVTAYETHDKEIRDYLQAIKRGIDFLKWLGITIAGAILIDILNYFIHLIHP